MSNREMTSTKLRLFLTAGLALVVIAGCALFYFGYSLLSAKAKETSQVATEADASNRKIQQLNTTKKLLENNSSAVERASKIVSNSQSYVYQDQIINDLNRIAAKSGIQILDISFSDAAVVGGSAASQSTAPAAGATNPSATTAPTTLSGGVKAVSASVRISEQVQYDKMLDFLYSVEQNLTKMSISKVSLRKADALIDGKPSVATDQLTIEVYVR